MVPVSWGCHHRVPPTGQLKTTETPLSVLKVRSLRPSVVLHQALCMPCPVSGGCWESLHQPGSQRPSTPVSWLSLPCVLCPIPHLYVSVWVCVCVCEGAGRELHHESVSITANLTRSFLYGGRADICHGALVGIRGLLESVFSFHCMSPGDQTQVMGLSGKHLSLWSHLIGPW